MRGENERSAGDRSDTDGGSFEDVRIESVLPDERGTSSPRASHRVPDWSKRLSLRGKLVRVLSVALAMIVALTVLLPHATLTFSLPPPIARLLTPVPQAFSTGAFVRVPLPVLPDGWHGGFMPSAHDPATAYRCMIHGEPGVGSSNSLWVTHDVGKSWIQAPVPDVGGADCYWSVAADGSPRVAVNMDLFSSRRNPQGCPSPFLSDDDGVTWRCIAGTNPSTAGGQDGGGWIVLLTARHLFAATAEGLERSDDDGQTWQRADNGLPKDDSLSDVQTSLRALDGTGESLIAFARRPGTFSAVTTLDVWTSRDAGASWRAKTVTLPFRSAGPNEQVGEFLTEARLGKLASGAQACHCVVFHSYPPHIGVGGPLSDISEQLYLSHDLTHWTALPPLPVPGASANRSGVYRTLGLTGDGRLVVLGADPASGVPSSISVVRATEPPPRLWAWNTHTQRWELAPTRLPCPHLRACLELGGEYPSDTSIQLDAGGRLAGAYMWTTLRDLLASDAPKFDWYRVFIPAA